MQLNNTVIYILILTFLILAAALAYRFTADTQNRQRPSFQPLSFSDSTVPSAMFNEIQITDGTKHLVPLEKLISGGPPRDGIPSIDAPSFISVSEADAFLDNDGFGQALEVDGAHRFYPYQILVWHEIVNDSINERPLAITYCPLCGTGIVFERTIENVGTVEFGTSGKLWNSNLVMYDRTTESYWSQVTGQAIVGELTGIKLHVYPSGVIRYQDWKNAHPNGEVLSNRTGYFRDYSRDPYRSYYTNENLWFPVDHEDDRLPRKQLVHGIEVNGITKAYNEERLKEDVVVNDSVGETDILIVWDPQEETTRIFNRTVNGETLTFEREGDVLVDNTGAKWSFRGNALNGSSAALEPFPFKSGFWFSWVSVYPDTQLY